MNNVRISLIVLALTLLVSATAYSQSDSISDLELSIPFVRQVSLCADLVFCYGFGEAQGYFTLKNRV